MIFVILGSMAFANNIQGEEIWTAPSVNAVEQESITSVEKKIPATKISKKPNSGKGISNIPSEYLVSIPRESNNSELIQPPKGSIDIFRGIKVGDVLEVKVPHSVIAFPDEKSPVIGISESCQLSGFRFIGESYLEKNTKRVFINISRVVIGQQIYEVKGSGVSSEGQPGLAGEYHSREAEYFAGDFIASFAAGYFDGLVPRRSNFFGQPEVDSSVDSAVKKGLASGALSTADRFREKLKKVPEFSEIKGPFNLKILILEQVKTTN